MMAHDVEVAASCQPLLGLAANFLKLQESQVADPMIEAATVVTFQIRTQRSTEPAATRCPSGDQETLVKSLAGQPSAWRSWKGPAGVGARGIAGDGSVSG